MKPLLTTTALLLWAASALTLGACSDRGRLLSPEAAPGEGDLSVVRDLENRHKKDSKKGSDRRYRVTIENLTSSQPFSPGIVATHSSKRPVFRAGRMASEGLRLIAENGDPSVAEKELSGKRGVYSVMPTSRPIGCKGCPGPFSSDMTFEISTSKKAKHLSLAVMLICTNDGFTGLHGVKLPKRGKPVTHYARGYDAGTEANDELFTSIVDACGAIGPVPAAADGSNDRKATKEPIHLHPGIQGVGDLDPKAHDWKNPVAKITIERLSGGGGKKDDDDEGDDD